jgi:hypothetical protein
MPCCKRGFLFCRSIEESLLSEDAEDKIKIDPQGHFSSAGFS